MVLDHDFDQPFLSKTKPFSRAKKNSHTEKVYSVLPSFLGVLICAVLLAFQTRAEAGSLLLYSKLVELVFEKQYCIACEFFYPLQTNPGFIFFCTLHVLLSYLIQTRPPFAQPDGSRGLKKKPRVLYTYVFTVLFALKFHARKC